MSVCLSDHDLEAFVGQGASEQELSAWSVHLESCDTCAARLARKEHALRSAASKDESDQEPKVGAAETIKYGRIRNTLLGYEATERKELQDARQKKRDIENMFRQMPARIAKYKELGMDKEAAEATQALITGKKQELAMMEAMALTITGDNWKQRRQQMIEAGAIDGSQMPVNYSKKWVDALLAQKKGEMKKLEITYGETDNQGKPTGRTMTETRLYQDGEESETFTPFEASADYKARTGQGDSGKPWQMTSGDTGQIKQLAAEQYDTILDERGNFMGLTGDDKRLALQLAERASEIYNAGKGQVPHAEAVAQAAREQGISVKSTRNSLVNDPAGIL